MIALAALLWLLLFAVFGPVVASVAVGALVLFAWLAGDF